jgi:hypothetical protein
MQIRITERISDLPAGAVRRTCLTDASVLVLDSSRSAAGVLCEIHYPSGRIITRGLHPDVRVEAAAEPEPEVA